MKEIKYYEKACDAIAAKFVKKYFKNSTDSFWIGNDIGGVFYVNDYYFDNKSMISALKFKASFQQIITYYNMCLEIGLRKNKLKRTLFSFENYLKYPNNFIIITNEDGTMNFKIK